MSSRSKSMSASIYKTLIRSEAFSKIVIAAYRLRTMLGVMSGLYLLPRPYGMRTKAIMKMNCLENLSLENGRLSTRQRLINDQGGITGRSYSFGYHKARYNACEAIAIHNALLLLGKKSTLSRAILNVQRSGAMWWLGEWGSDPARLGCVLKKRYGVKSSYFFNPKKPLSDGVYIISFWNSPKNLSCGLHTVALEVKGGMTFYNDDWHGMRERRFDGQVLPNRYSQGFILGIRCFPAEKIPHRH